MSCLLIYYHGYSPSLSCFQYSSFEHRSPVCTERYTLIIFACIATFSLPHPSIALVSPHRSGSLPEFVSSHMVPHHDTHGSTAWFHCTSFGLVIADFLTLERGMSEKIWRLSVKKFYFLIIWLDDNVELCFKSLISDFFLFCLLGTSMERLCIYL